MSTDDLVERLGFAYNKLSEDILEEAAARIVADAERIKVRDDHIDALKAELAAAHEDMRKCVDRWNKANGEANDAFMLLSDKHTLMTERAERAEAQVAALTAERDAMYRFARMHGHMAIDIQNAIDAARKGTTP